MQKLIMNISQYEEVIKDQEEKIRKLQVSIFRFISSLYKTATQIALYSDDVLLWRITANYSYRTLSLLPLYIKQC